MIFGVCLWLPRKVLGHLFKPVTAMLSSLGQAEECINYPFQTKGSP